MKTKYELQSPAIIVDLDIVERNVNKIATLARNAKKKLRPHIKPHKSVYFAKKQLEGGACGITVAKLSEAEVMAEHGVDDILVAYSIVGEEKLGRLRKLRDRARVATTVDSIEVASGLSTVGTAANPLPVLIEIDCGTHRGGRQPGEDALNFAKQIKATPSLCLEGIFTYGGMVYGSSNLEELKTKAALEASILRETATLLAQNGIPVNEVSGGSTPAAFVLDKLEGITEIRPGNYIFFDASGLSMGIAKVSDCALRVLATVVSVPLPGYATIDAGSKTLTSDLATGREGYGYIVGMPDVHLAKLNEEHGYMRYDPVLREFHVGDRVEVIPNHACVIPNLSGILYGIRGEEVVSPISVEARGMNY